MKRTPCVGICSTTYGDLVCRGCKRFAHEIDQWNGFGDGQRRLVWERLFKLREGALARHVRIVDETAVRSRAETLRVPDAEELDLPNLAYEVLRRSLRVKDFTVLGIEPLAPTRDGSELYARLESELYERAVAQYERDFHVPTR